MKAFKFRRRHAGIVALLAAAAAGLTLALTASSASLPGSTFEIDGTFPGSGNANLIVNTPGNLDWANVNQTQKTDLPTGQTDDSYAGGAKEDDACPGVTTGSIPNNKSDLKVFGGYFEPEAGGPGFLNVFWQRVNNPSGTTNMDFEFNKSTTDCGNGVNAVRSVNDVLLQFDVDQGGSVAKLSKRLWNGSSWGAAQVLSASDAIGSVNQDPITAADSDGLGAMSERTFGEASFDLSQVFDPTICTSFGSAMLKSRSSDSFSSQLKDFIKPIPLQIQNCAQVIIRKQTTPDGATKTFSYTKNFGTDPATVNTFTLQDGGVKDYGKTVLFGTGLTVSEDLPLTENWVFVNVDCSASTGVTPSISGAQVTFALDSNADVLDCTYNNKQNLGAILVSKQAKHAADGPGDHPQAGVSFTVNGVTQQTGADGTTCFDHLPFGSYDVTETLPSGYHNDGPLTQSVDVDNNATCADASYIGETASFHNTPLTDVSITVHSQVTGGTSSTVDCDNDALDGSGGDVNSSAPNQEPQTITCTIVIDP